MISAWHLLWVIPLTFFAGYMLAALMFTEDKDK